MNGDLKLTFILKTVSTYFEMVVAAMRSVAAKKNIEVTGDGLKSLSYLAQQQGAGATGSLSFLDYLRYVDMGVGRGHPLGGLKSMNVSLQASRKKGQIQVKDNVRKPKKIYSKVAYGKLGWMYNELIYGYTDATIESLKAEMLNKN